MPANCKRFALLTGYASSQPPPLQYGSHFKSPSKGRKISLFIFQEAAKLSSWFTIDKSTYHACFLFNSTRMELRAVDMYSWQAEDILQSTVT